MITFAITFAYRYAYLQLHLHIQNTEGELHWGKFDWGNIEGESFFYFFYRCERSRLKYIEIHWQDCWKLKELGEVWDQTEIIKQNTNPRDNPMNKPISRPKFLIVSTEEVWGGRKTLLDYHLPHQANDRGRAFFIFCIHKHLDLHPHFLYG